MAKKPALGSGKRFAAIEKKAAASGAKNPAAVAASAGFAAHGKKKMEQLAQAGKRKKLGQKGYDRDVDGDGNGQEQQAAPQDD